MKITSIDPRKISFTSIVAIENLHCVQSYSNFLVKNLMDNHYFKIVDKYSTLTSTLSK